MQEPHDGLHRLQDDLGLLQQSGSPSIQDLERLRAAVGAMRTAAGSDDEAIALLELLAYVGDQLSQAQEALANEEYLGTQRPRASLQRRNMPSNTSARRPRTRGLDARHLALRHIADALIRIDDRLGELHELEPCDRTRRVH